MAINDIYPTSESVIIDWYSIIDYYTSTIQNERPTCLVRHPAVEILRAAVVWLAGADRRRRVVAPSPLIFHLISCKTELNEPNRVL